MNKRKIQIIVGLIVGFIAAMVSAVSALYEDFPISVIIISHIVGTISMCVIIYAFLKYYK